MWGQWVRQTHHVTVHVPTLQPSHMFIPKEFLFTPWKALLAPTLSVLGLLAFFGVSRLLHCSVVNNQWQAPAAAAAQHVPEMPML